MYLFYIILHNTLCFCDNCFNLFIKISFFIIFYIKFTYTIYNISIIRQKPIFFMGFLTKK